MNVPSIAYYLDVQALVRKWRDFACNGDDIFIKDNYEAGTGLIGLHIPNALCDREEYLSFKIRLEDGSVEGLQKDISFACEVDGSSEYRLTDINDKVLATWLPAPDQELPSALLAPQNHQPERWVIDLTVLDGKVVKWPAGRQKGQELSRFIQKWDPSAEIGIQSL
jgi:hypothetical protein